MSLNLCHQSMSKQSGTWAAPTIPPRGVCTFAVQRTEDGLPVDLGGSNLGLMLAVLCVPIMPFRSNFYQPEDEVC